MLKRLLILSLFFWPICILANDSTKVVLELSFVGDIMQHGPQIKSAYNPVDDNYDYLPCFRTIAPSFRQADLVFANLELTLAGKPFSGYPTFSAPDELALALKKSGIDVLVTANNHSLDRRKKGLERTIDVLDSLHIPHTGTFKNPDDRSTNYPLMIQKKGVKIALLNYTYGTNGIPVTDPNIVNLLDTAQMRLDIQHAKSKDADLIVVFTHWGLEYQQMPNSEQKNIARFCKNLGVDLVIGSHPHVLQPIERAGDFITVYSLGNFFSNQRDRYKDGGMMFNTVIEFDTVHHTSTILEAGYELTWVYKKKSDYGTEYFILPAAHPNSFEFIENESDKSQMALFVNDSRAHLQKNNKGGIIEYKFRIKELPHFNMHGELDFNILGRKREINPTKQLVATKKIETSPTLASRQEQTTVFRIQFLATSKKLNTGSLDPNYFKDIHAENINGVTRYMTGKFSTKEEAEDHLLLMINETKYKDAFIVERPED